MARTPGGHSALAAAKALLEAASSADQIRVAQAVILPIEYGLSLEQTAAIVGRSASWVAKERRRFISKGEYLARGTRGGRRRQLVTPEQETKIAKAALMLQAKNWLLGNDARQIVRERVREIVGREPSESTVTRILSRLALRSLPDGTIHDLRHLSGRFTEVWLRERVLLTRESGKKIAV